MISVFDDESERSPLRGELKALPKTRLPKLAMKANYANYVCIIVGHIDRVPNCYRFKRPQNLGLPSNG